MSIWSVVSRLPIASYPVQRDFQRRWLVVLLGLASVAIFSGLTVWNVLTQGKTKVFTSQFLQTIPSTSSTSCQSARLTVGDLLFTTPSGNFSWLLNNVDSGGGFDTGANYREQHLTSASIISVGLTYLFAAQTYNFGICANVTVKAPSTNDTSDAISGSWEDAVFGLCTDFDLSSSNLPSWTHTAQQILGDRIFGLSQFYQNLSFTNGTFPAILLPPYGHQGAPSPSETTVTPTNLISLNIWMGGFRYLPKSNANMSLPTGDVHDILSGTDGQLHSLAEIFNMAVTGTDGLSGGMGITASGIGNIHLDSQERNKAINFNEPNVVTQMRNYTLDTLNLMMDMAIHDIDASRLAVSYLCTSTKYEWKKWLEMISMILGNNAALFGVAFAVMITIARWYELRQDGLGSPWLTSSSNRDFQPLRDFESGDRSGRVRRQPTMSHPDSRIPSSSHMFTNRDSSMTDLSDHRYYDLPLTSNLHTTDPVSSRSNIYSIPTYQQ